MILVQLKINHKLTPLYEIIRVEDRLMNYLLAGDLFTKINHKPIDLHYKFNIF